MTKYSLKLKRGIDDLKSVYAFHGNSQGDESRTNSIEEFHAAKGWLSFTFDCELTDAAIQKEIETRELWNEEYLEKLRADGTFGTEYEIIMNIQWNPLLDGTPVLSNNPLESYRMILIDPSNP